MAGWHVSDSDSETNEEKDASQNVSRESLGDHVIDDKIIDLFGYRIESLKMIELLQRVRTHRTLKLDCVRDNLKERRQRRRRKRKMTDSYPDGEVSETTSERISTYTPSTSGCRDERRFVNL